MAQGPGWVPHLLAFQEQGLQRDDPPETTPIYTPDRKAYKCYWHKRTPLYARTGIQVHLVHHLSIPGRLGVYEVVRDGWQPNVINNHVPFSDATEPFLQETFILISALCFVSPAACCWCRVSCCLFLEMKSFCLQKYSQSKIAQARGVQGEENQDQSMKGCSVNSER